MKYFKNLNQWHDLFKKVVYQQLGVCISLRESINVILNFLYFTSVVIRQHLVAFAVHTSINWVVQFAVVGVAEKLTDLMYNVYTMVIIIFQQNLIYMYLNLIFSAFIDHNNCNYSINHTYVVIFSVLKKPT